MKTKIVFDKEVLPEIRKLLKLKNLKCSYCGKRITKLNVGGLLEPNVYMCNSVLCMLEAIERGKI